MNVENKNYCRFNSHDVNRDITRVVVFFQLYISKLTENVPKFIEPDNWPPNSPDLNPVDYSIWGYLQQLVYRQKIRNIEHLKNVIIDCWSEISQEFIDGAIDQWSRRIAAVVAARGRHIEYSFD